MLVDVLVSEVHAIIAAKIIYHIQKNVLSLWHSLPSSIMLSCCPKEN
jgi:hypothetical protein